MTTVTQTFIQPSIAQYRRAEKKNHSRMVQAWQRYSPHFLAQDLNNEACSLLVKGENFPQAIQLLSKALELSKWNLREHDDQMSIEQPCSCEHCSLDACLVHQIEADAPHRNKNSFAASTGRCGTGLPHLRHSKQTDPAGNNEDEKYIYRRPLTVSDTCIHESHFMGTTLTVMILFNLALAHQLLANSIPSTFETIKTKINTLDKSLKLYELCIHAHNDCVCTDTGSLRLKLLVMNNLSEIHRLAGEPAKHRMCLDYLLRALMFAAHGRDGGLDFDYEVLEPAEIDGIYRNMQSSSAALGNNVQAAAA